MSQVPTSLRKIGRRCVLDETIRDKFNSNSFHIDCVHRFEPLSEQVDRDEHINSLHC